MEQSGSHLLQDAGFDLKIHFKMNAIMMTRMDEDLEQPVASCWLPQAEMGGGGSGRGDSVTGWRTNPFYHLVHCGVKIPAK